MFFKFIREAQMSALSFPSGLQLSKNMILFCSKTLLKPLLHLGFKGLLHRHFFPVRINKNKKKPSSDKLTHLLTLRNSTSSINVCCKATECSIQCFVSCISPNHSMDLSHTVFPSGSQHIHLTLSSGT